MATELADASAWPAMIDGLLERASALPPDTLSALFEVTNTDTRDADLAAVVRTAGQPGLTGRVAANRDKAIAAKAACAIGRRWPAGQAPLFPLHCCRALQDAKNAAPKPVSICAYRQSYRQRP